MPNASNLSVSLTLGTAGFSKGVATAKSGLASLQAAASKAGAVMANFAAGVGAAGLAAAGGLTALAASQVGQIDKLGDVADSIGIATEKLAGLRHAAELNGGSAELMDAALAKMVKSLGATSLAGGPAAEKLAALGINASELVKLSPDQQFLKVADSISKIGNPAERAAVAVQVFGKQGQQLLPIFNAGAAGIQEAMKEAEAFGLALNRADVAKVQAMNDAFARVKAAVAGVGTALAVTVAPIIEAVVRRVADFAAASGGIGPLVTKGFAAAAEGVALFGDGLSVIGREFTKLQALMTDGLAVIVKGYAELFKVAASVDPTGFFKQAAQGADLLANGLHLSAQQINDDLKKNIGGPSLGKAVRDNFAAIIAESDKAAKAAADLAAKAQAGGPAIGGGANEQAAKTAELQKKLAAATFAAAVKPAAAPKPVKDLVTKAAEPTPGPAAIERGSRDAFSIINARRDQQEKSMAKAVDILGKLLLLGEQQAANKGQELAVVTL